MSSGDAVQQVKDRLNILDVISPYVELHQAGKNFKGRSPFTKEKTPSFFVSPDRGMYYCFSTSQGGDMFTFVQTMEGVDFKEALKILAGKAGVELVPEHPQKRSEREQLYAVIEAATQFFTERLSQHSEAVTYLENRHVVKETIAKWRIGYAPGPPQGGWRELRQHLARAGFSDDIQFKAGLIKTAGSGKEPFDTFRDRVMFPLRDQNGKVVAFSGRILSKDSEAPKYVNSPETDLYHKSDLLFGYDMAKQHIRTLGFWLVVEGQFDVVMSHQAGYTNTVAVSGTAMTVHHVRLLERLSKNVVLALDADKAGIAAMKRAAEVMLKRGFDVKVATMPDGADPADLVAKDIKILRQAVGQAKPVVEFLLHYAIKDIVDERAQKRHVRDEVLPFVALIPDRIDQEHFEQLIAKTLATSTEAIHFEVSRILEQHHSAANRTIERSDHVTSAATSSGYPARLALQYEHLKALERIGTPAEQLFIKKTTESIAHLIDISETVDTTIEARVLFEIEREFEKLSPILRLESIVHAANTWRNNALKAALLKIRQQLGEKNTIGELPAQILVIQKALQEKPYTVEDIEK